MTDYGVTWKREDLGGGVFRHTQFLDQRHHLSAGAYRESVLDFEDSGDSVRPHIVTRAPLMFSVAPDGMRRFHPTRELDRYAEIGAPYIKNGAGDWVKPDLGSATRIGNRITWNTAQVRLIIDHGGYFAKLAIFLKKPNGVQWFPNDMMFAFPVGLSGMTRVGGTLYADGVPVMRMRAPHVEDMDNPRDVRPITHEFTQIGGRWYVVFTLPASLVSNPMSRVLVDPTLELQPDETAGIDTFIGNGGNTNANFGNASVLAIGDEASGVATYRTLIDLDFSAIPDGAILTSPTLSLYATTDVSSNARTGRVYRMKRSWVETQTTWNIHSTGNSWTAAGAFDAADCEQTDIGNRAFTASETLNQFKDFALTPTTKAGLDLGYGWLVKMDVESNDGYYLASSNNSTAANRPKFSTLYTLPSGLLARMNQHARTRRSA